MRKQEETVLEYASRIGCVHPHYLSFAGKCDGCRKLPISGAAYPDHYSRKLYEDKTTTSSETREDSL